MKIAIGQFAVYLFVLSIFTAPIVLAQKKNSNAKVYGIHMITLKPGVTDVEFEKFVTEKILPNWNMPGWKMSVIKGDRGDRIGGYIVLLEIESVAYRDKMAPLNGPFSEELEKHWGALNDKIGAEWDKLSTRPGLNSFFTDYYVIGQ